MSKMFVLNLHFIILYFGILLLQKTVSDDGACVIYQEDGSSEIDEIQWKVGIQLTTIDDTTTATLLLSRKTKDIQSINSTLNTVKQNYVNVIFNTESHFLDIYLTDDFSKYEEYEVGETLTITINFQCRGGIKDITINQPIQDSNNHSPEFLNIPYVYILDMPITKNHNISSHGVNIIARDIDISNTNVSFLMEINNKTSGFSLIWSGQNKSQKSFEAQLITKDLIDISNDVTFTIFAVDHGIPSRKTSTTITIKVNNADSALKFSQTLYMADCKTAEVGKEIEIKFDNDIFILRGAESRIHIEISTDPTGHEKFFKYALSTNSSVITLNLTNPSEKLLNEKYILLILNVSKTRSSSSTVLFIELPGLNDKSSKPKLYFTENFYNMKKHISFTGELLTAKAFLENGNGSINYSIDFLDNNEITKHLEDKVSIDPVAAKVNINKMISSGIYIFNICAKEPTSNLTASAKVLLVITPEEMEFMLQIIEVEEESIHKKLLHIGSDICSYTIISQTPSSDFFYIEKNFLNSVQVDRESKYFKNMSVAQVRLEIQRTCPGESKLYQRKKRNMEYDIILGNIPFTHSKANIIAIITDINDNQPIWNTEIPKAIGYPSKEVLNLISVQYVYNLSATDADLGENSTITYTIEGNSAFYINSKTGALYVRNGGNYAEHVTVFASDGTYTTALKLDVTLLKVENIAVLYVENAVLEDVENVISSMKKNLSCCFIGTLGSSVISDFDTFFIEKNSYIKHTETLLRILIYGLDMQTNKPLQNTNLQSVLEAADISNTWKILKTNTLEEITKNHTLLQPQCKNESNLFLILTIVLSLLLGAAIVGIALLFMQYKKSGYS